MKKIFIPLFIALLTPVLFSCGASRLAGYKLNEQDAAAAIRQMLQIGTQDGKLTGAFSKETIISTLFPGSVGKVLSTLQTLGLTNEVDRFANTFGNAAESAANNAVPVFVSGITSIKFNDAMRLIKAGGTSGTDYLKSTIGADLRRSITPAMQTAIAEYKLNEQWEKLMGPLKGLTGNRLNLDLANLMAGVVAEKMFQKIAEKEVEIRNNSAARSTTLLQKVFSRNWN